jgi:hypothetical protein
MTNEGEDTHAKSIADEVNSVEFRDMELRHRNVLLRIQYRALIRLGA